MIGKSLSERYGSALLSPDRATKVANESLPSLATQLVEVRAKDARMVACAVVRADKAAVRTCLALGFEIDAGGSGVFGLLGEDAARLFTWLPAAHRAWLAVPCGPREAKVLLIAGGTALLSVETNDGKVVITTGP